MNIINRNGQFVTDSREVAEMTAKRHSDLIRDIEGYKAVLDQNANLRSDSFFIESSYEAGTGKPYKCYLLTRKGCDMIANKMTGEKGVLFTAEYVTRFEEMEKRQALPPMSSIEMIAAIASQAVEQERRMLAMEAQVHTLTTGLTAVPDHTAVVARVNEYARWARIGHNEVYNLIYEKLQARHGIDVRTRVDNERIKLNSAYFAEKGRYYSESTLKSKVNGIDVMVRNGWLDKFNEILVGLLASLKERSLQAPTR